MSTEGKDAKKPEKSQRVRNALNKVAGLRAGQSAIEHRVQNARDVVEAKANAAVAKAKVEMAQEKRDIEQRVDDARIDMHTRR